MVGGSSERAGLGALCCGWGRQFAPEGRRSSRFSVELNRAATGAPAFVSVGGRPARLSAAVVAYLSQPFRVRAQSDVRLIEARWPVGYTRARAIGRPTSDAVTDMARHVRGVGR